MCEHLEPRLDRGRFAEDETTVRTIFSAHLLQFACAQMFNKHKVNWDSGGGQIRLLLFFINKLGIREILTVYRMSEVFCQMRESSAGPKRVGSSASAGICAIR